MFADQTDSFVENHRSHGSSRPAVLPSFDIPSSGRSSSRVRNDHRTTPAQMVLSPVCPRPTDRELRQRHPPRNSFRRRRQTIEQTSVHQETSSPGLLNVDSSSRLTCSMFILYSTKCDEPRKMMGIIYYAVDLDTINISSESR